MRRRNTSFPRRWLYYVVLKMAIIAGAVVLALMYYGYWIHA